MRMLRLSDRAISSKAEDLIQFDSDSIRQVALAKTGKIPEYWLVDPDLYESGGRVLRDSSTPRLLAYSPDTHTLYVNDGCNSCAHDAGDLSKLSPAEILDVSRKYSLRPEFLQKLASAIH